jgi:hypothetical protein
LDSRLQLVQTIVLFVSSAWSSVAVQIFMAFFRWSWWVENGAAQKRLTYGYRVHSLCKRTALYSAMSWGLLVLW